MFFVGYAKKNDAISEPTNSKNGINLEFQKYLFNYLAFRIGSIYWMDDWQYNVNITGQIPKTQLLFRAEWEHVGERQEPDLSILYKFNF